MYISRGEAKGNIHVICDYYTIFQADEDGKWQFPPA